MHFGAIFSHLRVIFGHLGLTLGDLQRSWSDLGPSWGDLGATLAERGGRGSLNTTPMSLKMVSCALAFLRWIAHFLGSEASALIGV